jgi:recombination protein RecA
MAGKASNKVDETVLKNLTGFVRRGASLRSEGNIPTTHFELDFIIQYGMSPTKVDLGQLERYDPSVPLGLPIGKLVEIFGEEGSGKSSLAYRVCAAAQKMGYACAWIDTENSFSANLAKINGLDDTADDFYYSDLVNEDNPEQIYHAETIMDYIQDLCRARFKVVVLDSLANLVPKDRWEASAEQKYMGLMSRILSENLGKVVNYAAKYQTLLIFINQLREKIGIMFGNPETSPGGRALKHNAFLRLKVSKKRGKEADITIDDSEIGEERVIGRYANVWIEKSKVAKPYYKTIQIPIYYEPYFPDIEEIAFNAGRQNRIITVRKGVFSWNNIKVEGKEDFLKEIVNAGLVERLIKDIKLKAKEQNVLLPPELMTKEIKEKKDINKPVENKDEVPGKVSGRRQSKDSSSSEKKSKK